LTGELDLASAPDLEYRLARLRARKQPVTLNLSKLEFIDSTGLHLLIGEIGDARANDWKLRLERDLSPQVMRLFKLVYVEHLVFDGETDLSRDAR
jgi:anti-sigma B factor antagonist